MVLPPARSVLAHINVARFRRPKSDPVNAGFRDMVEAVYRGAEQADGLVWRFVAVAADERAVVDDAHSLVNMSVWTGIEALRAFTYGDPLHRSMMQRRRDWFERLDVTLALWWIPDDTRPTLRDGLDRLDRLARGDPTPEAFTFARAFDADGRASRSRDRGAA